MKVLYLFLPVHPKCNTIGMRSMPPLALYYLATILEDNGIEVDIVDPSIISRSQYFDTNVEAKKFIGNLFDNKEYDAILFSATTGNWGVTKEMIQQIHEEFPNIPICVGGIHVSYFARYIITGMPYLIALKGEGEKNIVSVIQNVKNYNELKKIPNIVFYDGEQVVETVKNELMEIKELQEIKNVDYSKVPKNSYGCIGLETSRGCRFRCVFCSVLYKHIWRGLTEQFRNAPGNYKHILRTLPILSRFEIRVILSFTVTDYNVNEINLFIREARQFPNVKIVISPYINYHQTYQGDRFVDVSEETVEKLKECFEDNKNIWSDKIKYSLSFSNRFIGYCGFGIYSLYIDSFGKIILCPLLGNIQLGTITDGIENIWENSKILMEYRSHTIADIEKCNTCKNVNVCKGGCRARAYFINGSILACDPVSCKMY